MSLLLSYVVFVGLLVLTAMSIVVNRRTYLYTDFGSLSTQSSLIYVTLTTVLATGCTFLTRSCISNLRLHRLENELRHTGLRHLNLVGSSTSIPEKGDDTIGTTDTKWRLVLGLAGLREAWRNLASILFYALPGLVTTGLVVTLTPSTFDRPLDYQVKIPDSDYGNYNDSSHQTCAGMTNGFPVSGPSPGNQASWPLSNGSVFWSTYNGDGCPQGSAIVFAAGIHASNLSEYAYVDAGVAVHYSALGAPATIYAGESFSEISQKYTRSLLSTTQCVPVMISNPVRCQTGGTVEILGNHNISITVNGYTDYFLYPYRDTSRDSLMAGDLLTTHDNTTNSIGWGEMFMGAITDPQGTVNWAAQLAQGVNDLNASTASGPNSTYAVTCTITPKDVFQYRWVKVQQMAAKSNNTSRYDLFVAADGSCVPKNPTVGYVQFATAATANWNIVRQNYAYTGYLSVLSQLALQGRAPNSSYAFENSQNPLEDMLGVISAMVIANLPINPFGGVLAEADGSMDKRKPQLVVQATRVGAPNPWAILLCLPTLLSACILGRLLLQNAKNPWKPGGDMYTSDDERPRLFAGESIRELLKIGQASALVGQAKPLLSGEFER